jgi:hypothetical protein
MAKEAVGNWLKFGDFGWNDQPEDANDWMIHHTRNRDSSLIAQSNHAAIEKALAQFDESTVRAQHFGHWACGWVDGFAIKVHSADGTLTDAFKVWCEIERALADYPLLDDSDYSEREYNAGIENITSILDSMGRRADCDTLPDWSGNSDVACKVLGWLFDNEQAETESTDDNGAYPSEESIKRALEALGFPTYPIK